MPGRHRAVKVLAGALIGLVVADTLRGRSRLSRLASIPPGSGDASGRPTDDAATEGDFVLVNAAGVRVPPEVRGAAIAHADDRGLDVVDLVPADLEAEEALELVAQVDPATYRSDRLALGRGPFRALLVRRAVFDRSNLTETTDLDPVAFVAANAELKHLAPVTSDLAVAPGFSAAPFETDRRRALLEALFGDATPLVLAIPALQWVVIAVALVAAPPGVAALAAYCAQPVVALGDAPLRAPGLAAAGALRWWREPRRWLATVQGRWRPAPEPDPVEHRRAGYAEALAGDLGAFFEPRRDDCPLCGGTDLGVRLETTDIFQYKPGRFVLEECRSCDHVFQNPRLSEAGLDFYYRDFYDGLGEESSELIFGATNSSYLDRAWMVKGQAEPDTWLDVGGGHGHFCLVAREVWPETTFDGLDLSDSIEEAGRRGWVDHAYRGMFPEIAPEMADAYDVVSMHHYLEHTREPLEELDAAAVALRPGGHLLIELPDPESPFGRLLGRWWIPWFQPQHQNLFSVANLEQALTDRGFEVTVTHRGEAHQTVDLFIAAWLRLNDMGRPEMPWLPTRSTAQVWKRRVLLTLGGPVFLLAALIDQILAPIVRARGGSNTYRLLARFRGASD